MTDEHAAASDNAGGGGPVAILPICENMESNKCRVHALQLERWVQKPGKKICALSCGTFLSPPGTRFYWRGPLRTAQ